MLKQIVRREAGSSKLKAAGIGSVSQMSDKLFSLSRRHDKLKLIGHHTVTLFGSLQVGIGRL